MSLKLDNFLLVDSNMQFSREYTEFLKKHSANEESQIIAAGDNSRHLLKMMFDNLIKDYCYCDFANEISVSELATYLNEHHQICGVLISSVDYHLANKEQQFIFNSLHLVRYILVQQQDGSFEYEKLTDKANVNHLSCNGALSAVGEDIEASLCKLDS
ncbi:hypothetical protein PSECIP111854_01698 [Pseudoalteromonas sp. CIP111854]|uniref:Uncharacterized protein n=1 Tax=Pseudoalteromonas holothuriae TaxID=2963714 RepID=A0A9W4VUE4_9GAMM|nr:hypothetical protein [Pseudoalteromonas sp. CIP111854]CAH9055987.1 hypothetical protein PSECIP111854_01698 [Pseudoalteromonas sp. CIP111854]